MTQLATLLAIFAALAVFAATTQKPPLDQRVKDIDGKDVDLSIYKGKVVLLVNVASRCGNTPQYEGLQKLYGKYKDKGLVVLGFPANEFGGQESGTDAEIKEFCTKKYNVTFPMFCKVVSKGEGIHPIYQWLTSKETNPKFAGDIQWNFTKFLLNRDAAVVARFETKVKPEDLQVVEAIEKTLKSGAARP